MHYTIESLERRSRPGAAQGLVRIAGFGFAASTADGAGYEAVVHTGSGDKARTLRLSMLDNEAEWTVDGIFLPNGLPCWYNGFGSRASARVALAHDDVPWSLALAHELFDRVARTPWMGLSPQGGDAG
jgi:hypothetical protein